MMNQKKIKLSSKELWIEAYDKIDLGEELCPHDGQSLVLNEEEYKGVCPKCGYTISIDELARVDAISFMKDHQMKEEIKFSSTLRQMIKKYSGK